MRKLNVLIAGSTGYIGVQLVKLLSNHQNINIKYLCGNSSIGKNISFFNVYLSSGSNNNKALDIPSTIAPTWPVIPPPLTLHLTS